jgi:glyoxylase-like metal-dependent hydrolase (beta-lactamase superfamily II)
MKSVWTRRPGTETGVYRAPIESFPQIHQITLPTPWESGYVQVYLVEGTPLTLVDAGLMSTESRSALESSLDALGYALEEIERIVLTHYHRDHIGLVESVRRANRSLEVCAHENSVPMIEGFSAERDANIEGTTALFREYGVPADVLDRMNRRRRERMRTEPALAEATAVDRVLRDGDAVGFKDFALDVIHAPGHTAGHILLHHAESSVLVSGDHILGHAVPNTENYYVDGLPDPRDPLRRRPRFKGLVMYRNSLRSLRLGSFRFILPGFGGIIRGGDRAIREALLYYDVRIQRIERSLRSVAALGQSVTAYELWRALFSDEDASREMRTHLLMVIGALDVLEDAGACVTTRREDGVLYHAHPG